MGETISCVNFFDFKNLLKIGLSYVAKIYLASGLLWNARTCLRGKKVPEYFEFDPVVLEENFQDLLQYYWLDLLEFYL